MIETISYSRNIFLTDGINAVTRDINMHTTPRYNIKIFIIDDIKPFDNLLDIKRSVCIDDNMVIISEVISPKIINRILHEMKFIYLINTKSSTDDIKKLLCNFSQHGIPEKSHFTTPGRVLSVNDKEVFLRFCRGESTDTISQELKITPKKVSYHKVNVLLSLGISGSLAFSALKNLQIIHEILSYL